MTCVSACRRMGLMALAIGLSAIALGTWAGCTQHTIKVEPVQVNMNVRADIYLHVDKELDEFFGDEPAASAASSTSGKPASSAPATR